MRKTAAFVLVVIVLLAGMTLPGVALQDGPPDHAGGEGDGPPDHANAGDDGSSDGDGDDGDGDDEDSDDDGDDAEGEDEDGDDEATDPPDAADADDAADTGDAADDDADDEPTDTEAPDSDDSGESPTETISSMLPIDDEDDEDDESQGESAGNGPGETRTSESDDDPIPIVDDGETETPEDESTPTPEEDDGDDDSSESSLRSNGTGGDDSVSVEMQSNDSATVADVTDVEGGDTVEIALRGPPTEGESVALESVTVGVGEAGPFTLTATRPTDEGVEEAAPGVPVAYFEVRTDADSVRNATLTLAVDEGFLPDGVRPDDVEVLRYTDGGWETTETTYDEDEGVYTAETAGFSRFAVAAPSDGPLEVTDAEVTESENETGGESGEEATVVATVENTGDRQATQTFAATVDGETVATRELTLDGGEEATVTFDLPADEAENGTVAVDGVEAGRLQVEETESGGAAASSNGDLAFGVGAAVLVVLSAVGTGLFAARHEEWDWEL